jgi:hypothetical protein
MPFLKKKRKGKAFIKPFGKDLRKPLCAGILRKWFFKKREKPTLRWRMFSRKLLLKNLFSKRNFAGTSARV